MDLRYSCCHFQCVYIPVLYHPGVPLRCGRYTDWENRQIHKNIADFAALTDIGSAEQVLFPQRFKEQAAEIRRLKIQHHFLQRIGKFWHRRERFLFSFGCWSFINPCSELWFVPTRLVCPGSGGHPSALPSSLHASKEDL